LATLRSGAIGTLHQPARSLGGEIQQVVRPDRRRGRRREVRRRGGPPTIDPLAVNVVLADIERETFDEDEANSATRE
jgi:hypothetical protein